MEYDTNNMRLEDLIQDEFDKESQYRGVSTPDRNSEEEKEELEEQKEIFTWLMSAIHKGGISKAVFWFIDDTISLKNCLGCQESSYKSKRGYFHIRMAFNNLILKMQTTRKVAVLENTGSYVMLEFNFSVRF